MIPFLVFKYSSSSISSSISFFFNVWCGLVIFEVTSWRWIKLSGVDFGRFHEVVLLENFLIGQVLSLSSVRVKGAWLQDTGCSLSYSKTLSTLHYQRWGIILKTQLANKVCYSKHDAFISSSVSLSRSCRVYTCTKIKQVQADLY